MRAAKTAFRARPLIRKIVGGVFLAFLALLAGLETYVRVSDVSSPSRVDQTAHPNMLGDLKPDQDLTSREIPSLSYHVKVNSVGLRGEPVTPRSAVKQRILVIGDSYIFGQFMNEEETFPRQIDRVLRARFPDASFDVINGGRCGYTISDELDYFRDRGHLLEPSLVLLGYSTGDEIELAWGWKRRQQSLSRGLFRTSGSPLVYIDSALRNMATIYWLQERYWESILKNGTPIGASGRTNLNYYSPYDHSLTEEYRKAVEVYLAQVKMLQEEVERNGATMALILFPSPLQMRPEYSSEGPRLILAESRKLGIATFDLEKSVLATGTEHELFLTPLNNHPKASYYRAAAELVGRDIHLRGPSLEITAASFQQP